MALKKKFSPAAWVAGKMTVSFRDAERSKGWSDVRCQVMI